MFELSQPGPRGPSVSLALLDVSPASTLSPQSRASSHLPQPGWLLLKSCSDYKHQMLKEYICKHLSQGQGKMEPGLPGSPSTNHRPAFPLS